MSDALDNPFVFSLHRGAKVPLRKQTIKHRDHQIYGKGRDAAPEAAAGNETTVARHNNSQAQNDSPNAQSTTISSRRARLSHRPDRVVCLSYSRSVAPNEEFEIKLLFALNCETENLDLQSYMSEGDVDRDGWTPAKFTNGALVTLRAHHLGGDVELQSEHELTMVWDRSVKCLLFRVKVLPNARHGSHCAEFIATVSEGGHTQCNICMTFEVVANAPANVAARGEASHSPAVPQSTAAPEEASHSPAVPQSTAAPGEGCHNAGAAGARSEVTPKKKTEALP